MHGRAHLGLISCAGVAGRWITTSRRPTSSSQMATRLVLDHQPTWTMAVMPTEWPEHSNS